MAPMLDARLVELLAEGADRVVFGLLTDEEAHTVDHGLPLDFVVSPFLDAHPGVDPGFVREVGGRSLLARGLVNPREGADGQVESELTPELEILVRSRREGVGLLRAREPEPPYGAARTFVLRAAHGGFEEDVNTLGLHYVSACTYATGARRLAEWCVDGSATTVARGARDRVAPDRWAAWVHDELGPSARTTCIDVLAPPEPGLPPSHEVVLVAQAGALAVAARDADGSALHVAQVDQAALGSLLLERVGAALGPAVVTPAAPSL
ncbi:hypothetical protein [Solicola sp. PLA-1-18]|uniref:hypothetical protein n=1 Tax=Solicola sp. PLA-1-18 TaxID=3380532 RepID=UPI003B7A6D9A